MTRDRPFPRRRPPAGGGGARSDAPAAPARAGASSPSADVPPRDSFDAATLLREHLNASLAHASSLAAVPATAGGRSAPDGPGQGWRSRLADVGRAAGLDEAQEAEFERLARAQQTQIREEIPRLLAELKPHFGTPQEAEAKRCYEAGLLALKATFDAQTQELLGRFGLASQAG